MRLILASFTTGKNQKDDDSLVSRTEGREIDIYTDKERETRATSVHPQGIPRATEGEHCSPPLIPLLSPPSNDWRLD
jgi:hypothetical protein